MMDGELGGLSCLWNFSMGRKNTGSRGQLPQGKQIGLGQVTYPLWASASPPIKEG
jgi:hypothetical protein